MENRPNRSESLNELFGALAKAQAEMQVAELSSANPFFKSRYADFTTIVKASRPALTRNGLCVIQQILPSDGHGFLHTVLGHASGQFIETQVEIRPLKTDVQSLGSYLTYLKRYSYSAIVGITTGDDDDDGESAMPRDKEVAKPTPKAYTPPMPADECIESHDEETLQAQLEGHPDLAEEILQKLKIEALSEMKKSDFGRSLNYAIKKRTEKEKVGAK